jgi:hypothetical protein
MPVLMQACQLGVFAGADHLELITCMITVQFLRRHAKSNGTDAETLARLLAGRPARAAAAWAARSRGRRAGPAGAGPRPAGQRWQ